MGGSSLVQSKHNNNVAGLATTPSTEATKFLDYKCNDTMAGYVLTDG